MKGEELFTWVHTHISPKMGLNDGLREFTHRSESAPRLLLLLDILHSSLDIRYSFILVNFQSHKVAYSWRRDLTHGW